MKEIPPHFTSKDVTRSIGTAIELMFRHDDEEISFWLSLYWLNQGVVDHLLTSMIVRKKFTFRLSDIEICYDIAKEQNGLVLVTVRANQFF